MRSLENQKIKKAAELLKDCKSILFITGAGISADSGLPTYRGSGGIYQGEATEISQFIGWKRMSDEDISPEAPLFISRKHRRIGSRGVQHDLEKWVRVACLEGRYSPHALRHTVGFDLIRGTNNIRKVQEFLGHRSISTTQLYTHITKDELRECAELLVCDPGAEYFVFSRN